MPVIAQDAIFYKLQTGIAPVVDGVIDELWNDVDIHNINNPVLWNTGVPTLDVATWQATWNDTAIFILVIVEDDDHCDTWCSGAVEWESDRVEIYFDVNVGDLDDGAGPVDWPNGHYQVAPAWMENIADYSECGPSWQGWPYCYGYSITGEDYNYEYAMPFSSLTDKFGTALDPDSDPVIGFDVYITDRDEGDVDFPTVVWMNDGSGPASDHNWNNMDDCGKVVFEQEETSCNYDLAGTDPLMHFYYIDENIYDIEITLYDVGLCDELSIYLSSATVVEDAEISFEYPNTGYLTIESITDNGNTITGDFEIGNSDCEGDESGSWTVTRLSLQPGIPLLIYPADNTINMPTTAGLIWNPVAGATSYTLQVSEYQDFSSTFLSVDSIISNMHYVPGLAGNTTYYWRVKSVDDCDESDWSAPRSFLTAQLPAGYDYTYNNHGIMIYPSPADYYINISFPGSHSSVISIFTIDGKLLIRENMHDDITTIDVSDLSKGLYFIKVVNENTIRKGKFIID